MEDNNSSKNFIKLSEDIYLHIDSLELLKKCASGNERNNWFLNPEYSPDAIRQYLIGYFQCAVKEEIKFEQNSSDRSFSFVNAGFINALSGPGTNEPLRCMYTNLYDKDSHDIKMLFFTKNNLTEYFWRRTEFFWKKISGYSTKNKKVLDEECYRMGINIIQYREKVKCLWKKISGYSTKNKKVLDEECYRMGINNIIQYWEKVKYFWKKISGYSTKNNEVLDEECFRMDILKEIIKDWEKAELGGNEYPFCLCSFFVHLDDDANELMEQHKIEKFNLFDATEWKECLILDFKKFEDIMNNDNTIFADIYSHCKYRLQQIACAHIDNDKEAIELDSFVRQIKESIVRSKINPNLILRIGVNDNNQNSNTGAATLVQFIIPIYRNNRDTKPYAGLPVTMIDKSEIFKLPTDIQEKINNLEQLCKDAKEICGEPTEHGSLETEVEQLNTLISKMQKRTETLKDVLKNAFKRDCYSYKVSKTILTLPMVFMDSIFYCNGYAENNWSFIPNLNSNDDFNCLMNRKSKKCQKCDKDCPYNPQKQN